MESWLFLALILVVALVGKIYVIDYCDRGCDAIQITTFYQ